MINGEWVGNTRLRTSTLIDILPGIDVEITYEDRLIPNRLMTSWFVHARAIHKVFPAHTELIWDHRSKDDPNEAFRTWFEANRLTEQSQEIDDTVLQIQRAVRHRKHVDLNQIAEDDPNPITTFSRYPSDT